MAKVKITEIGQPCRHCETPVERREHKMPPKSRKGGYYYAWWLGCPGCSAIYMVESAKVMLTPRPPIVASAFLNRVKNCEIVERHIVAMFGRQHGPSDDLNEVPW
jgi:hypothetical protein